MSECSCKKCMHQMCAGKVPIFSAMGPEELRQIAALVRRREFKKGELIVMEEEQLNYLMIINQGRVKAYTYNMDGKEQILYIFSEGDFFGEKNLIKDQKSTYHIEAMEVTKICMIHKSDFQTLIFQNPDIGLKIMMELENRIEKLEQTIQTMGTKNVEARINLVLLEFANKYGKKHEKGIEIPLPLSREGIANYIGLTRETVSRKLSLMQDEGMIQMIGNKRLLLLDLKAVQEALN